MKCKDLTGVLLKSALSTLSDVNIIPQFSKPCFQLFNYFK